jgi:hypothetical protein
MILFEKNQNYYAQTLICLFLNFKNIFFMFLLEISLFLKINLKIINIILIYF